VQCCAGAVRKTALTSKQRACGIRRSAFLAQRGTPDGTVQATAAGGNIRKDNMVAWRKVVNAGSDFADDSRSFVSKHHRHHAWTRAIDDREIGMTKPRGDDLDQHTTGTWAGKVHFFDDQGF